jgi:hypothetical protein
MKTLCSVVWLVCVLSSCATGLHDTPGSEERMILKVQWQRLLDEEGNTCDRCGSTQEELAKGIQSLRASLRPLGIDIILEQKSLSPQECARDISESNRIWIANRPLEDWLGAEVGQSPCGSCCSELGQVVECRTVSVGGETYEVIPAELIVKAGLLAASQIMRVPSPGACCPSHGSLGTADEECCPKSNKDDSKTGKDSI